MSEDGERTFAPTPQRREQFRKDGRFPRARDAGGTAATLAAMAVIVGSRSAIGAAFGELFERCHGDLDAFGRQDAEGVLQAAVGVLAVAAVPAAIAAALAAVTLGTVQAGLRVNLEAASFKPERLNPLPRIQQFIKPRHALVETTLSMLRIGVVGYVAYRAMVIELPDVLSLARVPLDAACERVFSGVVRVALSALTALGLISVVDYAQSRLQHEKDLKMTRKEMMEEARSQEVDPKIKQRIRQRARALARKRSLQNVKKASVVVTNPTHVAVALRYTPKDVAPIVVAKGHDDFAMRIRAEARKHGIPILENRQLARALDAEVDLGQPVPGAHFAAVARVLAFVFKIRGRSGTARA